MHFDFEIYFTVLCLILLNVSWIIYVLTDYADTCTLNVPLFLSRQYHSFSACVDRVDAGYDMKSRIFNKQCNKHSITLLL